MESFVVSPPRTFSQVIGIEARFGFDCDVEQYGRRRWRRTEIGSCFVCPDFGSESKQL